MRFEIKGESVFATTGGRDFDPAKPVLIFLHGAGFDQSVWNQQSRYFAHRNHSVLAVDFPGNGRSTGKAPAEIGELADWVPHLMDASGVEEARLVGHSMGTCGVGMWVRYPADFRHQFDGCRCRNAGPSRTSECREKQSTPGL